MKTALLIVTLSSLLAGCASTRIAPVAQSAAAGPLAALASDTQALPAVATDLPATLAAADASDESLPQIALTEELMFKILSAEIAFQRGQWQAAYVTTLIAAQQTRDPRLARRAAEMAITAKQNGEALAAIRLWRELAPNSEEAAQYLLGFLVLSDDIDSSQPMFAQRLAEARPLTRGLMLLQIQRMLARATDKAAAFALLERLAEPYGALAETRIALAQGALANNDSARAIKEARTALQMKGTSELAILTLAQVLPDKADAARAMGEFLQKNPASRDVRLALARMQIEQKQYASARVEFETLLREQPDDLSSLYALGVLTSQNKDPAAAEKYLGTYLALLRAKPDEERDPTQAILILAQIAEERKDLPKALAWLAQIDSGPAYTSALARRAQLLHKQGDLEAGLTLLREARPDGEREQVQLVVALAHLLRDAGRSADGMATMASGIERFPKDPDLLYDYAMMAEKNSEFEVMETALRKLMVLAPKNQHAYNALGYSLAERNLRLPEAFTLIETALALAPDDPYILDSMGWVQFRMGRLKEAEEALRRAYSLRADPEIAVHLGEVLWVKGQKEDAQKLWRDANTIDPQNNTLKNTLTRLHVSL